MTGRTYTPTIRELVEARSITSKEIIIGNLANYFGSEDPVAEIAMSTPLEIRRASGGLLLYNDCEMLIVMAKREQER